MMGWVMLKHVFKKLYRELKVFVNIIVIIIIIIIIRPYYYCYYHHYYY